jgi:hypothetical protein
MVETKAFEIDDDHERKGILPLLDHGAVLAHRLARPLAAESDEQRASRRRDRLRRWLLLRRRRSNEPMVSAPRRPANRQRRSRDSAGNVWRLGEDARYSPSK